MSTLLIEVIVEILVNHPELPLAHRIRPPASGELAGAPCLLLLHGVGANETGLMALAAEQDPRLAVILIRSPIQLSSMAFAFFQVSFSPSGPIINADQAEASRRSLVDFIERLPAAYGIDPRRVWVAGFSQGGILSASVGVTRPDVVHGFGILSGRILPEIGSLIARESQLAGLNAFISHGVFDSKLGIHFARNARQLLEERKVRLTYQEYPSDHELNMKMRLDFNQWLQAELHQTECRHG